MTTQTSTVIAFYLGTLISSFMMGYSLRSMRLYRHSAKVLDEFGKEISEDNLEYCKGFLAGVQAVAPMKD